MPESSLAVGETSNDRKALGKHNWRAKLFANGRSKGEDQQKDVGLATDVTDFFNSACRTTPAKLRIEHSIGVATAQHLPSAAGASRSDTEAALHIEKPFEQSTRTRSASPLKRGRNKGLHVRFTDVPPLIIGEGGDEADLPPKEISRARWGLEQGHGGHLSDAENGEVKAEKCSYEQLPRQSSRTTQNICKKGNPTSFLENGPGIVELEQRQEATNEDNEDAGVLPPRSSTAEAFANAVQSRIKLEDQEVLLDVRMSSPSLNDAAIKHAEDTSQSRPPRGYTLSDIDSVAARSLGATPSLQSPSLTQANSLQSHVLASIAPRESPPSTGGSRLGDDAVQCYGSPGDGLSKAKPFSFRAVAHAIGSDALEDFAARIQHYDSVFRRTATADRPDTNIALVEWSRAARWWFLKGRCDLEGAIRSRPRSADSSKTDRDSSSLPDVSQAHIDLAKAWWILKQVIPEHPTLKHYGNAGMKSIAAIVRGSKDENLAQTVEMHAGLVASMRALTMSMKRNHLLPPDPEIGYQPTGLDMRIWSAPAPLASYLLPLLSSRSSQGSVHNGPSYDTDHLSHVPIGDTANLFCYGSMFVLMLIIVRSDSGEGTRLPCVLSIVREPTHRHMGAILASQDERVCLVIQSGRSAGLTWSDVEWKAPEWQIQTKLTDSIEVQVQFKEYDYNILRSLIAYNQNVMSSFEPMDQDVLLFETTLKNFTCLDPRRSKNFPNDAVKLCRLRLFEKNVTRVEGTGPRKEHQGYRMKVITPPDVKALGAFEAHVSCTKPVFFSYLRGEEGAPALLLQLSDEGHYSAGTSFRVVMTFEEAAQRAEVHSLLNATTLGSSERNIATLLLRNLSIRRRSLAGDTMSGSQILPTGIQWERLQIIIGSSGHTPHGHNRRMLSESLRICVALTMGTMTDRMNMS